MSKRSFIYRSKKFIYIWCILIGLPFIFLFTDGFAFLNDKAYFAFNVIGTIVVVLLIFRFIDILPGIKRTGYYWKENGRTIIEYNGNTIPMDAVEEIFLTGKYSLTKGIILRIHNNGKKIELPSQMLRDNEDISDTAFYTLFQQLLAENPQLKQEKDIHGNLIDCWYKK